MVYDFRESHIIAFEKRFLSLDLQGFYSEVDLDAKCNMFYKFIDAALTAIPKQEVFLTDSDVPWMTPFLKLLINERWKAYRSRRWTSYNLLKEKIKRAIASAKTAFVNKKRSSIKDMWSYVNFERGSQCSNFDSLTNDLYSTTADLLDACNNQFCSVMNPASDHSIFEDLVDDEWTPSLEVLDVWNSLIHLPLKATGSDNIPCMLYMYRKAALSLIHI